MTKIKFLVAGDFCPQGRVSEKILNGNYNIIEGDVFADIKGADISVVNLEAPIVPSKSNYRPISKVGPNLKAPEDTLKVIEDIGFNIVTLANNHILDYGDAGIRYTLKKISETNLKSVGAGLSLSEAEQTLYVDVRGKRIAIINCCEHEFSIAGIMRAGANPLYSVHQYYAIKEAKLKADYVFLIIHGGIENYQLPSLRMKEIYRFFIDSGADAVVNHHQHCYSGYEVYKGKPIFYGLGNFCFDWQGMLPTWYEGFMTVFYLDDDISFDIIPFFQYKDEIVRLKNKEEKDQFFNNLKRFNSIIADDNLLLDEHQKLMDRTMENYEFILSPYSISYTIKLFQKKLLPTYFDGENGYGYKMPFSVNHILRGSCIW